MKLLITIMNKN